MLLPVVLEIYAGTCNFSRAAMRAGAFVICFDLSSGPAYNVSSRKVQDLIIGWVQAGRVKYLLAGLPCQSWSRARMQPGGPQMLRDMQHLMGLPVLRYESERWKIENGNTAMSFCSRLAHHCLSMQVPFVFENPWTSLLWKVPAMEHLARRRGVRLARTDFCQWGTPWRKSTNLMAGLCNTSFVERKCSGYKVCSRTGVPHKQLCGQCPDTKLFWTHIAEPYPRGLCTAIVRMLEDAVKQLSFDRHGTFLQFASS